MRSATKIKQSGTERSEPPIKRFFAEYFNETLENHRKTCKDPQCDERRLALG
jgi:hypothetical protein